MSHDDNPRDALIATPEELVAFAQAYFATEFPNGDRRDCPSVEELREVVGTGTLPDANLCAHLFRCSECFRYYRGAQMSCRPRVAPAWWHTRGAFLTGLRPYAFFAVSALCLVFFGMVGSVVWHAERRLPIVAARSLAQERSLGVDQSGLTNRESYEATDERVTPLIGVGDQFATLSAQPRSVKKVQRSSRPHLALHIVEIDLKEDRLLRGADDNEKQHVIILSRERQQLRIQMPDGSLRGRYTVRLVDAFGKPIITRTAYCNGRTLMVALDLRSMLSRNYRLCIEHGPEAPDCYLVNIGFQSPAP